MATPNLQYRKDILVMVAWNAAQPTQFTNWCGATGIDLSITNNISETETGDCEDWSLPAQVIRAYGAQAVTATVNASLTKTGRDKLIRAVKDQRELPIRFHMVEAASGEVEFIDGTALLPNLNISNIGAVAANAIISYVLNLSFKDGVEFTDKA